MKKLKLDSEEVVRQIVNYALREYDADYEYVKKYTKINGVIWFQYFWDTPESHDEWIKWTTKFLKTKVNCKGYNIGKLVSLIDLCYGLKVYENE